MIAEAGVARTSHRVVAERAGVPLGSTTYYFPSLAALVTEALERVSQRLQAILRDWETELSTGTDLAGDLARLAVEYVSDRPRALLEYELYLAAARSTELRSAARAWTVGCRDLLEPLVGRQRAVALTALLDGFMLETVATGQTPSTETMRAAIADQLAPLPR